MVTQRIDGTDGSAQWNGREDSNAHGAALFRDFWERALALPDGPWSTPFDPFCSAQVAVRRSRRCRRRPYTETDQANAG